MDPHTTIKMTQFIVIAGHTHEIQKDGRDKIKSKLNSCVSSLIDNDN